MRLSISFTVVAAALWACTSTAEAATPAVHDEAGFFKPETITTANKIISDVKLDDKKDLLVETFSHVPTGKEKEAAAEDTRGAFFTQWADRQAGDANVNGVYVLICKEPPYVKVVTDGKTGKTFNEDSRNHLENLLTSNFEAHKYDEGLLEGVRYVQSVLKGKNAEASGVDKIGSSGVHDAAGFFKPDAITKADEIISAIKRDDKKDLRIETFLHAPAGKEQEAKDPDTRPAFFKEWADDRGREQKVNGVYVLICKDPSHIKVVADNRTAKIFNEDARNHLSKLLGTRFKAQEYDDGLLEGAHYVQTALKGKVNDEQTSGAEAPAWPPRRGAGGPVVSGGGMMLAGLVCVGLVVLLAVVVVLMVVMAVSRAFHRGPVGYGPGGYGPMNPGGYGGYGGYGGGQGGGFLSSMLGGLFGGAAGGWAYDRFFGGRQGQTPGPAPHDYGTPPPQQETGYTGDGGGGDFGGGGGGDTGGDADFGGGGDFGGGDAGGGGDFGGGGGGDTGGGGSF